MKDADQVPCPKRGATGRPHELVNDENGRTSCKHCNTSWAGLDARIRRDEKMMTTEEVPA